MTTGEKVVEFPIDVVQRMTGFSMDMGGSVCKVIFRHKDDWEELQKMKPEPKMAKLRFALFRSEDAAEAIQMLKEKCHIARPSDGTAPLVYATGIGSNTQAVNLEEVLDIKLKSVSEIDSCMDAFAYLSQHLPRNDFVLPMNEKVVKIAQEELRAQIDALNEDAPHAEAPEHFGLPRPLDEGRVEFPALMIMCGSAFASFKLQENGDYTWLEVVWNGGRTFIGMGSLLTGAKTYDELIDLAEKGDHSKVDEFPMQCLKYVPLEDGTSTLTVRDDVTIRKEDVALALLYMHAEQVAQLVLHSAFDSGCPHAFLYGGFFNRDLVKDAVTKEITKKMNLVDSLKNQVKVKVGFSFIRNGQFVGAIGTMMYPLLPKQTKEK